MLPSRFTGGTSSTATGGTGKVNTGGTSNPSTTGGGVGATGGSSNRGGANGTSTGGVAVGGNTSGGAATGGATSTVPSGLVNTYDGARSSTTSFDLGWKFHLGDVSGAQNTTFDDSSWTSLDVPHDWSISLAFNQSSTATYEGGYLEGGLGWYRKAFTLPAASSGQKLFVQFDGVYMDSTVYLNGTQVCARPYGYSSFECDVTASAKTGASNVLAVKVNNQTPSSRWYSGSGIYRHTWLKTVNPVRVAYTGTQVTTPTVSTSSATVNIKVTVQNDTTSAASVSVTSSVRDASGTEVSKVTTDATSVAAAKTADVAQTTTVSTPKLWSPATPNLYSVVTTVSNAGAVVDTYTTPLGIRTFAFDANSGFTSVELFLNNASKGSKTNSSSTGHLEWSVPFATGTLEAHASKGETVVVTDKVQTAGAAAALVAKADRTSIKADGRDLSFVEIDVQDAQGILVPQANNSISFAISGPGTLVGVDNGDATSHESYKGTSRSAFSGKALAIVQSTTTAGTITLKASSGSLTASSVTITTTAP